MSTLVRDEIQLAQAQLTEKGKSLGTGAGLFAGAGVFALFGLGWLLHTAYLGLALALPAWASALIVAVVVLIVAAILALIGRNMLKNAPAMEAKENIQRDIAALKEGVGS